MQRFFPLATDSFLAQNFVGTQADATGICLLAVIGCRHGESSQVDCIGTDDVQTTIYLFG